jgi:hypothetical protein
MRPRLCGDRGAAALRGGWCGSGRIMQSRAKYRSPWDTGLINI